MTEENNSTRSKVHAHDHHEHEPKPTVSRDSLKVTFVLNLFMSNFLANVLVLALLILLPMIKTDLHLGYRSISLVFICFLLATELGHFISAKLAHRLSIFHLLFSSNFSLIFACLLIAFSTQLWSLLLGIVIVCIGRSFLNRTDRILVPYSSPLLANYGMFFSMMMAGVLVCFLLDYQMPWEMIFFLFMPLSLLLVITNKPYLEKNKVEISRPNLDPKWRQKFYQNPQNWIYISLQMSLQIFVYILMLWTPIFIVDQLGRSMLYAGVITTLWFLCFILGRILFDMIDFIKKGHDRPRFFFFLISFFSSVATIIIILTSSIFPYLLAITGLFFGYLFPLLYVLIKEYYQVYFSQFRSIIYFTCAALLAGIHLMMGVLANQYGLLKTFLVLPLSSLLFLGLAFVLWRVESSGEKTHHSG